MTESRSWDFTDEKDLALIRQALDALAATLVANESSPRESLSGKTANGRFDKLLKAHREHATEAAMLSGVSEDESEKVVILDEIIALIDDHAARQRLKRRPRVSNVNSKKRPRW
ncbi:hypothetical protein F443_12016 [Phytophthora nicotianae P1569]|uniref:Uncharacterized protein n=1 Tax=Phytophthora nicotianae P1569 TaxID=1317065 RepID=V9EUK2_PHYNI|nr:hypothetical protein F443_12016 [Phytophthora nicotianae P1569]